MSPEEQAAVEQVGVALQAEIAALRAEVERLNEETATWRIRARRWENSAERYREALEHIDRHARPDGDPMAWPGECGMGETPAKIARVALSGSTVEPPKRCPVCDTGLSASREGCPYHPTCPTCGSDDPATRWCALGRAADWTHIGPHAMKPGECAPCPDPWHRTTEEGPNVKVRFAPPVPMPIVPLDFEAEEGPSE